MLKKISQESSSISNIMMIAMPVNNPSDPPSAEISPGVYHHRKYYFFKLF
jgi:hypothetical protein